MKTVQFIYKCKKCGTIYTNLDCSVGLGQKILIEIAAIGKSLSSGISALSTHSCYCGGMGISDLIGIKDKDILGIVDSDRNTFKAAKL